jgi:hypothetical protein
MERYTQKPQTQGERRTDNTPTPVKTQQEQDKEIKNISQGLANLCWKMFSCIAYLMGSKR